MNNQPGIKLTDQELVRKSLQGDRHAFEAIVKNTEGLVAQMVFKMIPNSEDRKDLAQEVYLRVFRNLEGFRFQSKLSTWIGQITYNCCLNWLEKKKLLLPDPLPGSDADPLESLIPEGTSKIYVFRARKLLRENLLLNYKKEEL